jgi:hypothetical protein
MLAIQAECVLTPFVQIHPAVILIDDGKNHRFIADVRKWI